MTNMAKVVIQIVQGSVVNKPLDGFTIHPLLANFL